MDDLTDIAEVVSPRQARRQFLSSKRGTVKESTVRAYKFPTKHFVEYCEKHGIEVTGDITSRLIESWKQTRKDEVKLITAKNNVKHVRVFIKYCERNDLVERGLHERIDPPSVPEEESRSDDTLRLGHAEDVLRYLSTYEYASRKHAMFQTMWHTCCRISGAMALDVDDLDRNTDGDYILKFRNRKAQGTPLKNGNASERNVTITDELHETLSDYIALKREDVTDEYGREPLFTTPSGRLTRNRAYKNMTDISRPCKLTGTCPHDYAIDQCDAAQNVEAAPGCPSSVSNHPVRRGAITYHINRGWPKEKLSERVDVSVDVLNKHYDARKKEQKRQGRKQFLDLL